MPVDRHAKVELVLESVSPHPLVRAGVAGLVGGFFLNGLPRCCGASEADIFAAEVLLRIIPSYGGHP